MVSCAGATAAWAQRPTPPPAYDGKRVIVTQDVPNRSAYEGLEQTIATIEQASPQTYYVVVIASAGAGEFAAADYADDLFASWIAQARRKSLDFDSERSVLAVIAVEDRTISVHPGAALQREFGLTPSTIDQELVRDRFIPLARAGDVPRAIVELIKAVDDWIAQRDEVSRQRRAQASQIAAQVREDARTTREESVRLVDEARKELTDKAAQGLDLGEQQKMVERAANRLSEVGNRLESEPQAALRMVQQSRQELVAAVDQARQLASEQVQAALKLDALPDTLRGLEQALAGARQTGFTVDPIRQDFEAVLPLLEEARAVMPGRPTQALSLLGQIEQRLAQIQGRIERLPDSSARRQTLSTQVQPRLKATRDALARAAQSGADVSQLQKRFQEIEASATAAADPRLTDAEAAAATLAPLDRSLQQLAQSADEAASKYRFRTRTLPLALLIALVLAVLAILGIIRLLHLQTRRNVTRSVRDFRSRATLVMERLDALKERHKLLPVSDPDFEQPMSGQTLELYESAQLELNALWDRWLKVMDTLEQAQTLVEKQSPLGVEKLKEAEELVANEALFDDLARAEKACQEDLDHLNRAHEEAGAARERMEQARAGVDQLLAGLEAGGLPIEPHAPARAEVERAYNAIVANLVSDPVGTMPRIEALRDRSVAVLERLQRFDQALKESTSLQEQITACTREIAEKRATGLRLAEPQGNPDAPLAHASDLREEALDALRAGELEAGDARLAESNTALEQVRQTIQQVEEARQACRDHLAERRQRSDELAAMIQLAQGHVAVLEREFNPASWREAAAALQQASQAMASFASELDAAELEARDDHQDYLKAAGRLQWLEQAQQSVTRAIQGVGERLESLVKQKQESQPILSQLIAAEQQCAGFIATNDAVVGQAARAAWSQARDDLETARQAMEAQRPDWPSVAGELAAAQAGLEVAQKQAQADVEQYRELQRRVDQARTLSDEIGHLLRSERKDRPAANARYSGAVESLAQVVEQASSSQGHWNRWLEQVQGVISDFELAGTLAHDDIRLANQAIAAIAAADRMLRQVRTFSSYGITADAREAVRTLERAQTASQSQRYEDTIQFATQAEQAARTAHDQAVHEAEYRRRRFEAERRRREAAERARAGAGMGMDMGPMISGGLGSILGEMAEAMARGGGGGGGGVRRGGGFGGAIGGFPAPRPRGSSSSSWGRGSSQSSW